MKNRMLSLLLAGIMAASVSACGTSGAPSESSASAEQSEASAAQTSNVAITMLNSKPEITDALQAAAAIYEGQTGVKISISETDDAGSYLTTAYAAGDTPTMSIVSETQIKDYYEYSIPLNDEKWVEDAGDTMVRFGANNDVYAFPLTIEAKSVLYNKTAIEKVLGRSFDASQYLTYDAFKALLDELVAGGMESPTMLNSDDWSIGNHVLCAIYSAYDNTADGATEILSKVTAGEKSFADLANYNSVLDVVDLFKQYNINKADPLAADYDLNCAHFAEGDVAFWINGTFVWPNMEEYVPEGTEYGVMPYPTHNNDIATGKIISGVTKWIIVDGKYSSAEQQQAAKDFLNWLVDTEEGQKAMVDDSGLVPAFASITRVASNDLNASLQKYIQEGETMYSWTRYPSDHRSALGGYMQMYLADSITRDELTEILNTYWRTAKG